MPKVLSKRQVDGWGTLSALHLAAESERVDMIGELLRRGTDVMSLGGLGRTALHVGVELAELVLWIW